MKIEYIQGNILDTKTRFVFNPCDPYGFFSIDSVRNSYPYSYSEYRRLIDDNRVPLGTTQLVKCRDKTIINAIIYNNDKLSYDALKSSLGQLENLIWGKVICFPAFAFSEWAVVSSIIEQECISLTPKVFIKNTNFLQNIG